MKPWYENGLNFQCTGCGKCCTGSPGYVWLTEEEALKIAKFLHVELAAFYKKYTKIVRGKRSLVDLKPHYDCVFFKDQKCQIYSVRPSQCAKFPFWPEVVSSPETWENTKGYCEGIEHPEAPLIPYEAIQKTLNN